MKLPDIIRIKSTGHCTNLIDSISISAECVYVWLNSKEEGDSTEFSFDEIDFLWSSSKVLEDKNRTKVIYSDPKKKGKKKK